MAVKRMNIWLDERYIKSMDLLIEKEDMKNQSDFLSRATEFYVGYLSGKDSTKYISDILIGEMEGIVKSSENRLQRQLSHNTTELNMLLNILSATMEIDDETIQKMRIRCLKEVKEKSGAVSFESAFAYQKGGD